MTRSRRFRRLAWGTMPMLAVQCLGLDWSMALSWPTVALVLISAVKLLESRRAADHRLVALLQLLAVGLLAAQMPGLLPSALQLLTALMALAGLLAQEFDRLRPVRALLLRSLQLVAAALPLALALFVLLPRMGPLGALDGGQAGLATTGLAPDLDPQAIAQLVRGSAPAARLSYGAEGMPPEHSYWRVLVHQQFDGRRWRRSSSLEHNVSARFGSDGTPDRLFQWWTVERSRSQAVPWDGRSRPASEDLQQSPTGELLLLKPQLQQRSYRLQQEDGRQAWQWRPPTPQDLSLPRGQQPRLEAMADEWRQLPTDIARVAAAEAWFRQQPFRYSLQPGQQVTAGLDGFLFDQQVGFCGHYASAFSALMRASGVPARVVSGYHGGRLVQPLSGPGYLDLRQSDAHAWSEIWLKGQGWHRVDPTRWITSIDRTSQLASTGVMPAGGVLAWLRWQWWGLDLAWTQWWLGFDRASQTALLQQLFGEQQAWLGSFVLLIAILAVALGVWLLRWFGIGVSCTSLQRSLKLLQQLGLEPLPGESFAHLCHRAAVQHPEQAVLLQSIADQQQRLTYASLTAGEHRRVRREWRRLRQLLARSL